MPTNIPLIFSFILIPISSFFLWLPWSTHVAFFHPPAAASSSSSFAAANLNLDSCSPLPPGPEWCAEPIIHRESRLAYFHCDDTRPWWDPLTQTWERAPQGRKGGSVWVWDLKDPASQPQQLHLQRPTTRSHEPFHPLSLSVVTSKSSNATNVLLIANHPRARAPGVVDVYRHDLGHDVATQYDRIEGHALGDKNPYRIDAVPEKWSAPVEAPEGLAGQEGSEKELEPLAIPSFLFTSIAMPECPASDDENSSTIISSSSSSCPRRPGRTTPPTLPQYLLDVLPLPSFLLSPFTSTPTPYSPSPPITINYYLSTPHSTRPIFSTLSSHPSSPPLLRHWNGGGPLGGSNTSLPHAYVVSNSGKTAMLEQWDQHWVGVSASVDGRGEVMTDGRSFRDVWVKWPSMVTFWSAPLGGKGGGPVMGMDVDTLGRVWTVGAVSQGRVAQRVEELRQRGGLDEEEEDEEERKGGSAGALIRQTTYIHRLGGAIGHPWEVERLARVKQRGVWLPKEFYSTVVYRLGLGPAPSAKSGAGGKGYLPGAPTGVAVDEVGRRVLVTSSWEKRGAVCEFKEGWVEEMGEGSA